MSLLFKEVVPFAVVEKELKRVFVENVVIVGDMRRGLGRPKHSVLGSDRMQIDLNVGCTILAAILADYEAKNGKLDKSMAQLYFAKPQRQWASQKLSAMAAFNWAATGGNPIERMWKAAGKLLNIGVTSGGLVRRIASASATPLDIHAFGQMVQRGELMSATRATGALLIAEDCAKAMGSRTLEAAYAEECERFRFDTTDPK
jgi:hypothetical protein